MTADGSPNDIAAIRDVFVSTGMSSSGAAKAVLTFSDKASAAAVFETARKWFFYQEVEGGGRKKFFNSVKWWERNYRHDNQQPASGYGLAGAPAGSSQS